jgi:hypothetical protein
MNNSRATVIAVVAAASLLALATSSASARTRYRKPVGYPPFFALRFYSSPQHHPVRYYRICGYGDCPCLHSIAIATGSQVWWDRYDACTG